MKNNNVTYSNKSLIKVNKNPNKIQKIKMIKIQVFNNIQDKYLLNL